MHLGQCFLIIETAQGMPSLFLSFEIKKQLGLEKYFLHSSTYEYGVHDVCPKPYRLILS